MPTIASAIAIATATVTKGLLVRLQSKPGKEDDVQRFLVDARSLVEREQDTTSWFAVRFGRSEYGSFVVFPGEEGRSAHLSGAAAAALRERGDELFADAPQIARVDVLADKLPTGVVADEPRKGLLLSFTPKPGREDDVVDFLQRARGLVEEEPRTLAWFAIRFDDSRYGIFDVFPDKRARLAHLTGRIPRDFAKRGRSLLRSFPDMRKNDVLTAKLSASLSREV